MAVILSTKGLLRFISQAFPITSAGTMACLRHMAKKNTRHRYSYMNHYHNMRLGRSSKIDPITLMQSQTPRLLLNKTPMMNYGLDDEIYLKDDSEQKDSQNKSFYDYPMEDDEETDDGSDDNEAPFKMGNSKQSDGTSVPMDLMLVDLNQPLEEKDTIDENKGKAPMCLPHLQLGQP
ncbi:hypothetical protein ACH5RR_000928 [Cinchona calisaya]|uniref:Uncharacterized protein n=1 Tax=Cinchona calisaya TaxID=153742 RepID=A0ABD3B201_9GENT